MRKAQKEEIIDFINSLHQSHEEIKEALKQKKVMLVQNMLSEAQEFAVSLGTIIEKLEGEGHITVSYIEEYCEILFHVFEDVSKNEFNENKVYKTLKRQLIKIENSVKNDISIKIEIAFFPYKASMWDSLESVYLAAKEDPDCDVYCIPIPYYDLNPDRSFGQMHYEGGEYPKDIEVVDYRAYNLEERKPDVIYTHYPYDEWNLVTSIHPRYYTSNLKKYTECLVYIPYYATSGGMSEGQRLCPAYINSDYIVIQSPKLRDYFDERIPDEKFLPFGSPKFDRVLNKCKNPPKPPEEWKEKMYDGDGRKKRVIFYNTSLGDMLANTENFIKKIGYVFKCFEEKEDVCLLWRPHPLTEATLDSLRPEFRMAYEELKKKYIESSLGIYDATPDVTDTVALSDAYIGDAGSSITSLFGVAGKPIFILNNSMLEESEENDWWKDISIGFNYFEKDRFTVAQGNELYVSEPYKYNYRYFCNLAEEKYKNQYSTVYEIDGKWYACPSNAQDILVIGEMGVEKKVELEKRVMGRSVFSGSYKYDKYLLLILMNYPSVVRYDTVTGEISYFTENMDMCIKEKNGEKIRGGALIYHGSLYIVSPMDNMVYKLDIKSGKSSIIEIPIQSRCGGDLLLEYKDELWIMPYDGHVIVCWNPETNKAREYGGFPEGFICKNPVGNVVCEEKPFGIPIHYGKYLYLPSWWSNMSLQLDMETGIFKRWIPAFESEDENSVLGGKWTFLFGQSGEKKDDFKIYSFSKRKLYSFNLNKNICQEIKIQFDIDELENNEAGFCEVAPQLPYACIENHINTLSRFLRQGTVGNTFDRERQINAYRKVNINHEGNCGKKVHDFIKNYGVSNQAGR